MGLTAKLSEHTKVLQKIVTADHTTATDAGWVACTGFRKFGVATCASVLTGVGVNQFKILGNPVADGSGTDVVLATHAIGSAPDAVGDMLWLEVDLDDLGIDDTILGVSAQVKAANAADDTVCTYILSEARYPTSGLTADVIA